MTAGTERTPRDVLESLYRAALAAVDPRRSVQDALGEDTVRKALKGKRIGVFAVGKAAAGMYEGAMRISAQKALVVLPPGYPAPAGPAEVLFASHPVPDRSSVLAARRAIEFFSGFGPDDVLLCLISGGASSLLCLPRPGVTLGQKRAAVSRLVRSGATIAELNRLRTRLSAVKGGRLAGASRARIVTLVLSDVAGDRPELVGSGPTIRSLRGNRVRGGNERSRAGPTDLVRVIASNRTGLLAAAAVAGERGYAPVFAKRRIAGSAVEEGTRFARAAGPLSAGEVLLAGGESTVALGARRGRGGRTLEFALAAALELERLARTEKSGPVRIDLLAAASDGLDGNSGLAGAFADRSTAQRARDRGLDPQRALGRHDTGVFFEALGDALSTGPTGTNVCDWAFAMAGIPPRNPGKPAKRLPGRIITGSP